VLHATAPTSSHGTEIVVLTAATLVATGVRFVLFKAWVFRARRRPELIRQGTTPDADASTAVTEPIAAVDERAA
ncbi:hypothetical protein, partial [Paraburkholderia sp. BR14264]|uniref:hypothetical protein n=1 Tax=Paraburkholderia sp. BR14264 TaxID=3237001 RepID=UPI003978353A